VTYGSLAHKLEDLIKKFLTLQRPKLS